jgi:hypothetical protein
MTRADHRRGPGPGLRAGVQHRHLRCRAPRRRRGLGHGQHRQQLGGSIGTSLLNTIFASTVAAYLTSATLVHGRPSAQLTAQAVIHGYATAFWWSAAILAGRAVIALALFRSGPLTRPSPQPEPGAPAHATATPATRARPACGGMSRRPAAGAKTCQPRPS